MPTDTSFVAFGALNSVVESARSSVLLRSLGWSEDRAALEALDDELAQRGRAGDDEALSLRKLLIAAEPAQAAEIALGRERARVAAREPDRSFSRAIEEQLARDKGLGADERARLEQTLAQVLREEARSAFHSDGKQTTIEHVGRLAHDLAARLTAADGYRPIGQPMALSLAPGELQQLVLRVRHRAPCVISVTHLAHLEPDALRADPKLSPTELVQQFHLLVRVDDGRT
ncbi:MAG: hypothetical protein ABW252_04175 [Polyangiales bacterium]